MLRFYTAGESHGQALLAFVSGLPASLPVSVDFINHELHRRQLGYGRGGRQKIEKDKAEIFAGVRRGETIGAPIAIRIDNRDWANWEKILPVEALPEGGAGASAVDLKKLVAPRPGHADLAGSQKFNFHDARYVLERASARETAARVAGSLPTASVSFEADVSETQVIRSFSAAEGLPPHAYLVALRVERAKRLIRDGLSLADVADQAGFSDQSHMSRHFKRLTSVTPGQFAKATD